MEQREERKDEMIVALNRLSCWQNIGDRGFLCLLFILLPGWCPSFSHENLVFGTGIQTGFFIMDQDVTDPEWLRGSKIWRACFSMSKSGKSEIEIA